jgi:hypothetical protein
MLYITYKHTNDFEFIFCMLIIFSKNLIKPDIVLLAKNNINLKFWDGGGIFQGHIALFLFDNGKGFSSRAPSGWSIVRSARPLS